VTIPIDPKVAIQSVIHGARLTHRSAAVGVWMDQIAFGGPRIWSQTVTEGGDDQDDSKRMIWRDPKTMEISHGK
jgi:hypothetical protein